MASKAQVRASNRYNKAHTVQLIVRLNRKTDADILERLAVVGNKTGYVKKLIREDMEKSY